MKGKKIIAPILCLASVATLAACSPVVTDGDNLNDLKTEHVEVVNTNQKLELSVASLNTEIATLKNEKTAIEAELADLDSKLETALNEKEVDAKTISDLEKEMDNLKQELSNKENKINALMTEIERLNADEEFVVVNSNEKNEYFADALDEYLQNITVNGKTVNSVSVLMSVTGNGEKTVAYMITPKDKMTELEIDNEAAVVSTYFMYLKEKSPVEFTLNQDFSITDLTFNESNISWQYIGTKEGNINRVEKQDFFLKATRKDGTGSYGIWANINGDTISFDLEEEYRDINAYDYTITAGYEVEIDYSYYNVSVALNVNIVE